ncbi:cupin domain-containing protein [Leekyejoonella antrihumi]|uniref:Cupin domain-containing protein n=1 Tax=Leekyejoonella antrihumi TaxID=1660198 RepID=A0A563DZZ1_9MICO|nr:cupin domain-containing protein [Leekyejoonella antrihumi]TWP35816.1 cupin domain-containing protein [Leekyejoonella antrihumi]
MALEDVQAQASNAEQVHWPDWRAVVRPSSTGPQVTLLHQSETLKVVLVGLASGQALPPHAGAGASFHILDGEGEVLVGDTLVPVAAGSTVVVADGLQRSVRATTSLSFLGNLGDPASEE